MDKENLEALIAKWYDEIRGMTFNSSADFSAKGYEVLFSEVEKVRGFMSRLEFLLSEAKYIKRKFIVRAEEIKALYEEGLDKLKVKPQGMINKGYSYHEREATYRSDPSLLEYRVRLKKFENAVADLVMFLDIAVSRMKYLESCKNDLLLQSNLIRLGYNNLELK
jgi:hypothetical protein